jgi:signal transduction histidine kinase
VSSEKPLYSELETKMKEAEELIHALRTQQVDAIVGERHVMLVRLKQAEENLKSSRNQLRALATYLLSVRESERTVIARELHDEFGQALTSLQLGLSWISRKLTPAQRPLREKVKLLSATTTSLIRSVKNIASELRPGVLDELGLIKTLQSEAREFQGHTGIRCMFKTNSAKAKFDRSAAVAIFRIVQATLTNVARHARASRAFITLMKEKNEVILTVKDNGKGITRKLIDSHESLGITGMRERTLALGGTFALGGSRSKGTMLTVRIPLSRVIVGTPSSSRRTALRSPGRDKNFGSRGTKRQR